MAEFNAKFAVAAAEKGSAFRRPTRSDLEWIFTVQTERAVAKDNAFTLQNQIWQIDQTRWRHSLAGCTVSIHEHLDETISLRYGPHVVGRYDRNGDHYPNLSAVEKTHRAYCGSYSQAKKVKTGEQDGMMKADRSHANKRQIHLLTTGQSAAVPAWRARTWAMLCGTFVPVDVLLNFWSCLAHADHFRDRWTFRDRVVRRNFKQRGRLLAALNVHEVVRCLSEARIAALAHDYGLQLG